MSSLAATEESRALLQDRLAVLGKWMVLMFAGFSSLALLAMFALVDADQLVRFSAGDDILMGAVPLALWIGMRRGAWSIRVLRAVDAMAMAGWAAAFALMCSEAKTLEIPYIVAVTGAAIVAITRAIVVPSSGLRTLWISAIVVAPVAILAGWLIAHDDAASEFQRQTAYIDSVAWAAFGVALAVAASRITFGLRREVGRARRLGQYQLDAKIGEGGNGAVYRASHAMLRRPTAIKLLHHASDHNLQRFEREVQLTAQLTHPNTVAVYDYGRTPDGVFYYAMEWLDGIDLEQLIKRDGRLEPARVISVLRQVADALAEAHGIGLIHRDIKPANIILCQRGGNPDVAKVVDFGLVKNLQDDDGSPAVSMDNVVIGTPLYLSPEAIREPDAVDARSDLYAVGAVGYYLLTGEHVFDGASIMDVCAHHLHTEPQRPSERARAALPADLEAVVLRCLAKDAAARYATADELTAALDACADATAWTRAHAEQWWRAFRATGGAHREPRAASRTGATVAVTLEHRAPPARESAS